MAKSKLASRRRAARRIGVQEGADFNGRREIILREAARAFNERGVRKTSLDDVAGRLGVTKPALYHYVSSKDELIALCLGAAQGEIAAVLDEADDLETEGLDKLRHIFRWWARFATTDFGRSIVLIESSALSAERQEQHLQAHRLILKRIEKFIENGIADGSVKAVTPAVTTLALMGMFNSPARWFREGGSQSIEDVVDELTAFLTNGLGVF